MPDAKCPYCQQEVKALDLAEMDAHSVGATEPRAFPPIPGEDAIEPRIVDRSASADYVLAWVAGLGSRDRRALVRRVRRVQGSAAPADGFAVELANYIAARRMTSQFFGVAENPRRFNRAAYEKARAPASANGAAEPDEPRTDAPTTLTAGGDASGPADLGDLRLAGP